MLNNGVIIDTTLCLMRIEKGIYLYRLGLGVCFEAKEEEKGQVYNVFHYCKIVRT